ncbi:MAG: phosphate ABC transporter permease subunit PstC [Clostridia bacterium]|nr:phosphate ABC transporter permease subunit PstC [Clostridia bacterium]
MDSLELSTSLSVDKAEKKNQSIRVRLGRLRDSVCESGIFVLTASSAIIIVFIFIFILIKSWNIFAVNGINFVLKSGFDQQIIEAYHAPADKPVWHFGALGLLLGSGLTTVGALLLAIPLGIGTAIVITELSPRWMKGLLQSFIRLLASIPSVIYGLVALLVVVPFIQDNFITSELQLQYIKQFQLTGNSLLAGIAVLSIMITPVIVALSVDAINAVPHRYKEASLALGLSHWRTIVKVIVPSAKSGITAGIILGTGRAIGEALALSMVSGGIGNIPNPADGGVFFLTPILTLASAIINKSESMSVPSINAALFACGVLLLVTCTTLSLFTKIVERSIRRREGLE